MVLKNNSIAKSLLVDCLKKRKRCGAFLGKQKGQISIFMALIFPVLFVFFAMTINVGLLVHDKINLQNSVDLAAYYAAGKQAEILNAIAHLNYQLRQNWKLLAFRIRGFGNFGFEKTNTTTSPHPWRGRTASYQDEEWGEQPTICTQHAFGWREKAFKGPPYDNDPSRRPPTLCFNLNMTIPGIIVPRIISGVLNQDFNNEVRLQAEAARIAADKVCEHSGITNWLTGAMWLRAYKKALITRKYAIKQLAEKLKDGKDLLGDDIEIGARRTFENNLTRSNRKAHLEFDFFNSMEGIEWKEWLVERPLIPFIYYSDAILDGNGNCTFKMEQLIVKPFYYNAVYRDRADVLAIRDQLDYWIHNDIFDPSYSNDPNFPVSGSIVGYEKNPWYMVHAGVLAKTNPQEPFSPLVGDNHTLVARAFAKPFGGRIGPWMFSSWPSSEPRSEGNYIDKAMENKGIFLIDTPPPIDPTVNIPVGDFIPNYSRYPGDFLGLKSQISLGIYTNSFFSLPDGEKLSYDDFYDESPMVPDIQTSGDKYDPLIWNKSTDEIKLARILEVMAISPDLFDITYYSIDPQFYINYREVYELDPRLIFGRLTMDFGARPGSEQDPEYFGILDQWAWMNNLDKTIFDPAPYSPNLVGRLPAATWFVKDWKNLLTGWVPDARAEDMLGKCDDSGDITTNNDEFLPGSCGIGGRVGYSVKLVSKRYLESDLKLGGPGTGAEKIENPPPF